VGADVVDGALVAVIARVALIDVVLSAFACSAVIIIIIILKERNAGTQDNGRAGRQQAPDSGGLS
jgi:4-amino-4-deoxy-L-arabinose transferase-like glycosyltransferase